MPGIDFNRLRREISMVQVLNLLGFEPVGRSGSQWYGVCPLHESRSKRSRSFSVNVALGRYYCHRCESHGNALELWSAARKLPLYQAAIELCERLGQKIPWVRRW